MKKMKSILGFLAFGLAIMSAFAFKPSTLINEAFINGSGQCQTTSSSCPGGTKLCRLDVSEDSPNPTLVDIYNYQVGTTCGTQKRMN